MILLFPLRNNVISSSTNRMIGKAILKLFELRIFSCATQCDNGKPKKTAIECNCQNPRIFASCRDLPKYSCCAVMRFQRERFSNVVYNTLTEKLRIEFHAKALRYLHLETKKCDSCKNENFPSLILKDLDFKFRDGFLNIEDKSFKAMVNFFESLNLPVWRTRKTRFFKIKSNVIQPIILNFLNYDFRACNCQSILHDVYSEMIKHCHGGHNTLKLIDTKIHLASIFINLGYISEAWTQLARALNELEVSLRCVKC